MSAQEPGQASDRRALRRRLRAARRALTPAEQRLAADRLARTLRRDPWIAGARRVAAYQPEDGEIDPRPFLEWIRQLGASIAWPCITRARRLRFATGPLVRRNRFGIAEPAATTRAILPAWTLDLVLVPLVGFDAHGARLGMGGGFYDRTFARRVESPGLPGPRLIGIAHECQRTDSLPVQPWDVSLDAIATPAGLFPTRQRARSRAPSAA